MATAAMDNSLFQTPEMYQQAQYQQQVANNMAMAQLTPEQQVNAGLRTAGWQAGQGIANALGSQDPMLQRQSMRNKIMQQLDPSNPQSVQGAIQALVQAGDTQGAQSLYTDYLAHQKTQAEITAKTREQLPTIAKMQAYRDRLIQAGAPQSDVDAVNAAIKAEGEGKGTKVNVGVSTGENSYGTTFGKGIAENDLALRALAQKAPEILAAADTTEKLLQSDKVFTGTGASAKLNLLALGQGLGVTGKNANEIIANTQQLQQQRSQAVLSQIKASGLGTGQGFTDKDLKFLQDSAAGSITLSKETLQRQIDVERKVARAAGSSWNSRLKALPQKVVEPMGLSPVSLPSQTSFGTVEEANAAQLPKGTAITVGGRKAIVE